jgi:Fe-S cluster assembly scaffold protein SufB
MKKDKQKREIVLEAGSIAPSPIAIDLSGESSELTVRVGRGAKATLFDTSSSKKHRVHIETDKESTVTYVSLSTDSVRHMTAELQEGASIHWHCTTLGTTIEPHTLSSELRGKNATSNIDWIFRVGGNEKQIIVVRNIFAAPEGGGEITLKGVAEGTAYASCEGMIEITEEGRGTNTYLTEDVLMLDPTAKIDAIPGLEIRTNDVKASHSATVSRVTVEDLFYFQSRGITSETARAMYVDGFLGDLTERIVDEAVRKSVQKALMEEKYQ